MPCIKIKRLFNRGHMLIYGVALSLVTTVITMGYLIGCDRDVTRSLNKAQQTPEVHHFVFLKVHKAASSTMMNVFMKYGISHNLNIMVPQNLNTFSQNTYLQRSQILHYSPTGIYDLLCCHVIYNKTAMAPFFPPDTLYIGIVREPFKQFISAFNYYHHVPYLKEIPGDNPIATYLRDPAKFEPEYHFSSFTNNRMSLDFGYPVTEFANMTYMEEYLNQLESELDFVIVVEYFDESLLMMKRFCGWTLKDIMYIPRKMFKKKFENFTDEDRVLHRKWAKLDYMLYERFLDIFLRRLKKQPESFHEELHVFRTARQRAEEFCSGKRKGYLQVEKTSYNEAFLVTRFDCNYMTMGAIKLVDTVRDRYIATMNKTGLK